MIGSATLEAMLAAGLTGDQMLAIVKAMEADAARSAPTFDAAAERRRAYDRNRKRKVPPENSAENSTGNSAEASPPKDINQTPSLPSSDEDGADGQIWTVGRAMLIRLGVSKSRVGSVLGKWKRDHGVGETIEALAAADRESRLNGGLVDPISFVEGVFRHRSEPDRPIC